MDLGERVTFGFRGNTIFPTSRLISLVEEQRLIGFSTDYVTAIKGLIEDEYRNLGYAEVSIEPFTFEKPGAQERHVTYAITEGPRVTIESINFDGNLIFTKEKLREEFFRQAPLQLKLGYYVAKDVARAAELMIEWMKSNGYLSAKLITINSFPGLAGSVRLTVYIYEGDQTTVTKLITKGATVFSPEAIGTILKVRENEPLNLFAFTEGLEVLKATYRARGYLGMYLVNENSNEVIRYFQENRKAEIQLDIFEGHQFKTGRIVIEGHGKTRDEVIRRELTFSEGEVLTESALLESEARLRRLGIFSIATIRAFDDPGNPSQKTVRISVQEGTPGVIAGGPGFRNDLGIRAFGQISYANLGGKNHTLSLSLIGNRRLENFQFIEGQAQLAYLWPWFLNKDLTFRPTFTVTSIQYISFSARSTSLGMTFEKRLVKTPNITGALGYTLERITQFNSVEAVDDQDLEIGSISPAIQIDLRDNPLSPRSGVLGIASFDLANRILRSQNDPFPVSYTRFQFRTDGYVPLFHDVTWFLSFRTGVERNTAASIDGELRSGAIPSIKTFTLGGPSSLRGFKEQQLNKYSIKIAGTLNYVNYRTQLDLPLSGAMKFGPFLDAANLLVDQYSLGADMRYGAGMGFHYQTPVGPVNLDWGFNLAPRDGEDYWNFHFSIGVI